MFARLTVEDQALVFFNGRWEAPTRLAAIEAPRHGTRWLDLHTDAERAAGASPRSGWQWVHVALAPDRQTLVGVLDWEVESSGPVLHVVASRDRGATWVEQAVLDKPHFLATFQSLRMEASGTWRLTVQLDDCAGCGIPAAGRTSS